MPRPRSDQPTPGELEVLQVLWRLGPATVREVMDALNATRPRAYTSVMSLLNVMVDKGLLEKEPRGRAFAYVACAQEEPTLRQLVGDLLQRAFRGSAGQLVAHALEQTDPSPAELDELRRLIDAYRDRREDSR